MNDYNYILAKADCCLKHIQIIPNGINTQVFAFLKDEGCKSCMYKSVGNEIARVVQRKAQLNKEVGALGGKG